MNARSKSGSRATAAGSRHVVVATVLCLLVGSATVAEAADGSSAAKGAGANIERQVKKLKQQVKKLRHQVASIALQPGVQGERGPQGLQGAQGPQGPAAGPAGGDLTGTFPNPEIAPFAIGSAELAGGAITHDTSVINTVQGNFTSKIANGAIGRTEIADDQVQSAQLGTITTRPAGTTVAGGQFGDVTASCLPGEQVISGGGIGRTSTPKPRS